MPLRRRQLFGALAAPALLPRVAGAQADPRPVLRIAVQALPPTLEPLEAISNVGLRLTTNDQRPRERCRDGVCRPRASVRSVATQVSGSRCSNGSTHHRPRSAAAWLGPGASCGTPLDDAAPRPLPRRDGRNSPGPRRSAPSGPTCARPKMLRASRQSPARACWRCFGRMALPWKFLCDMPPCPPPGAELGLAQAPAAGDD